MGVLHDLLDAELAYDPVTAQDFSDHLPMALVALDRLGADDERLARFSTRYARSLVPVRAEVQAARDRYDTEVASLGVDGGVRAHLPRFVPGIGSAAFHAVIRLAYAVEARHAGQVAAALAYFEQVDEPLTDAPPNETGDDPFALLDALRADPRCALVFFVFDLADRSEVGRLRCLQLDMHAELLQSGPVFDNVWWHNALFHGTADDQVVVHFRHEASFDTRFGAFEPVTG